MAGWACGDWLGWGDGTERNGQRLAAGRSIDDDEVFFVASLLCVREYYEHVEYRSVRCCWTTTTSTGSMKRGRGNVERRRRKRLYENVQGKGAGATAQMGERLIRL